MVRLIDLPTMTIAVDLGRKATKQTNKTLLVSDRLLLKGCINYIQTLQKGEASSNTGYFRNRRSSAKF